MPSLKSDIDAYKVEIEDKFARILYRFSAYLRDKERNWDGKELLEAETSMCEDQLALVKHMLKIVANVASADKHVKQKIMFADFLEHISENVHSGDTTDTSLNKLDTLMLSIRETSLSKTREEFEIRANLFYLVFEMENYLNIKKKLFTKNIGTRVI